MKKLMILLVALLVSTEAFAAMPKFTIFYVRQDQMTPEVRARIRTGIKWMLSSEENWPEDPIPTVQEAYLMSNPDVEFYFVVFWTHHLAGRWVGKDAVRSSTQAQRDTWWDTHKTAIKAKRDDLVAYVNVPSFGALTGDDWVQRLTDSGAAVVTD